MMKPSLFIACVIGAFTASVSTMALADDGSSTYCKTGFYAGVQGGQSDTGYDNNDIFSKIAGGNPTSQATNFPNVVFPNQIPGQGNPGFILIDDSITSSVSSIANSPLSGANVDSDGLGGRIYAGYQFNPYFALETGFTVYTKTNYKANQTNTATKTSSANYIDLLPFPTDFGTDTVVQNFSSQTNYSGDLTEDAIDLVLKVTIPLDYGFGIYGDAGGAFVQADRTINSSTGAGTVTGTDTFVAAPNTGSNFSNTLTPATTPGGGVNTVYSQTDQALRPVAGAGLDYTIPSTPVDVSVFYNYMWGNNTIQNASLYGLGVGVKFA